MSLSPLAAYQQYKNTQQPVNSSNTYGYSGTPNGSPPPVVTAREILANRNTIPTGPPPSSLQRGGGVLDSPIPSAASIAHFTPSGGIDVTGEKKPTQTISSNTLALINARRQQAGLGPIQNEENVTVKPSPPSYSPGTESFRSDTMDTLKQLSDAKASGLTSLDIFDQSGKKIATTNPQDITRARYDILAASLASGGPVTAKGQTTSKILSTTSTSGPDYFRQNDNAAKTALASLVEPGAYIGLSLATLPANLLGRPVLGVKPGSTSEDINKQIESRIGPTYLDQLLSGNFNSNNMTPAEKVASLIGSGVGLYLTGGGGGGKAIAGKIGSTLRNLPSTLNDISKGTFKDSSIVSKIASGVKEGTIGQYVGPRQVIDKGIEVFEKGSPLREISQGTAGKSGIESFKPETGAATWEKNLSTEPGAAPYVKIEPQLPSYLSKTTEVTGIGAKGQPVKVTKPTEVKLDTGLEGETQIPHAVVNPQDATILVRSGTQKVLPPDKLLVEFQGLNPLEAAGRAVHYGLEEVPGAKNVYFGRATPQLIERLSGGIKSGAIKEGTDLFYYNSKEFARHPNIYGEVTRNPDLFQSKAFGKGGAFEGVSRPGVIRYFVGGIGKNTKALSKIGRNDLVRGKSLRSFTGGGFDLNNIGAGKVGAGAAGRAINLLKDPNVFAKSFGKTVSSGPKARMDAFGTVLSPEERRSQSRGRGGGIDIETISYPNVLHISQVTGPRSRSRNDQRNSLLSNIGLDQVSAMTQRTKQKNENLLDLNKMLGGSTVSKSKTDTLTGLRFKLDTGQTTDQITKQITKQITIPGQTTRRPPREPGLKLAGYDLNWDWPTGNKKRRRGTAKTSFFSYSVNPDVAGVIAEAGSPGKAVSSNPIRFRGSGRGPKLSDLGKGFKINIGGGRGGGKIASFGRRGGGKKGGGGRRGRGTALYGIDLGL